ncbi:MAG: C25 family cysteine peptidase [Candidatus Thermoplasmatota archaeon]
MKNIQRKKFVVGGILLLFLASGVLPAGGQEETPVVDTIREHVEFSAPRLTQSDEGSHIILNEANGLLSAEGCPALPMFSKTFEFPLGTQIVSVEVSPATIETMSVEGRIRPAPMKQKINDQIIPFKGIYKSEVYDSADSYPASWYTLNLGAGVNKKNDHTLFVTVHLAPVRYAPNAHSLSYSTDFTIEISYKEASPAQMASDRYSLVIIAPAVFSEPLQPLVEHKNTHGLPTLLVPLEEIYGAYYGRDEAEQIKYFVHHAVEQWDTQYILLVGDMKKLPIRVTYASWWEPDLLSDLYYADIYDATGAFCSWDSNENDRFGEIDHDGNDRDGVDLYADVHLGRLACADVTEVSIVVDKIITYEEETYNQIWFKRLVLAGGDTFPVSMGAPPNVFEGEITNIKVGQTMPDFEQKFLWTSKGNLHPTNFNRAINTGAGFVSYAGHGFEHGWGTYRPNAITKLKIFYYTPYISGLKNDNKLPIIFFDACLTAKLDFNVSDLQKYYPGLINLLVRIFSLSSDPSDFYQCFSWSFLAKETGGAIATIGSTRTAYTWVDASGVYGGAGYLDVHFFDAYEEGTTVGQMLTSSQNDYIQYVGADYFTLEEFILLGDPSLRTGGYP